MVAMFMNSKFNGDISRWNVSNTINMSWMFHKSMFNHDISGWDVSNVKYYDEIFDGCMILPKYMPEKFKYIR